MYLDSRTIPLLSHPLRLFGIEVPGGQYYLSLFIARLFCGRLNRPAVLIRFLSAYSITTRCSLILGVCNFAAPGIWGAMNSLGAGGAQTPWLINGSNALTFGLMVFTATLTPVLVRYVGVRWALAIGAAGYAPYAAGILCNLLYDTKWGVLVGAALCGISAGERTYFYLLLIYLYQPSYILCSSIDSS